MDLIQSNTEQENAAMACGTVYCCLAHCPATRDKPWTWKVALTTNDQYTADEWWRQQPKLARVYYSSGAIRNAK